MTLLPTIAMLTVRGIPLPQPAVEHNTVTLLMLCCCFFSIMVLTRCRTMLAEDFKTLFLMRNRTRNSLFNLPTVADRRLRAMLVPQACILVAVYIYFMYHALHPEQTPHRPFLPWIGLYSVCCLLYIVVKRAAYAIVGWVFLDRRKVRNWMQTHTVLLRLTSVTMLPAALIATVFCTDFTLMVRAGLALILLFKLLILFKWIKLFCDKTYGYIPICVYFCALEIIPLFYMVIGIMKLNDFVVF